LLIVETKNAEHETTFFILINIKLINLKKS